MRFLPLATTQLSNVCDCSIVRKVSTRTASRSPRMSVDEFATHISSSLPAGRSRVRPGRLIVSTSQLRPASVVIVAVIMVSVTICVKCPMRVSATRELGQTCESGVVGVRTDQMLAEPLGCGGFCYWKLVAIGVEVSARDKHKLLGLERLLIGREREIREGNRIVRRDDHQQRGRRDARCPNTRLVHARKSRGPHRHRILPFRRLTERLEVEVDGVLCPIRGWDSGVLTDDRLAPRGFTPRLCALVIVQRRLQRRNAFWRDATQALLIAANRRHLRDHAGYSAIGGPKNQRMATSIAGAPQSDPLRIYLGPGFQIGDRATPIGDLPPGINVLSRFAATDAKGPVVVEQHHEAGVSEGLGEPCDAVFPHAGVAVGHRDGWVTLRIALRKIEPGAKFYTVVDKSDFTAGGHRDLLMAFSGSA